MLKCELFPPLVFANVYQPKNNLLDIIGSHLGMKGARKLIKAGRVIKAPHVADQNLTPDTLVVYPDRLMKCGETDSRQHQAAYS